MKQVFVATLLAALFFYMPQPLCAQMFDSPKREVRAVWLTTIGGLDWPRQRASSTETIRRQQEELCATLDALAAAHFNTVFLQTRIRATVIYPSAIEPWDGCLTGHPGRNPGYDPLAFAIEECHKRQMECHAWLVCFPAHDNRTANALKTSALNRRQPAITVKTGDRWMLNPGHPSTAPYIASIAEEIASHYDIDGIHLDYIRYPEKEVAFSDAATFRKYGRGQKLASWRRASVTACVRAVHDAVKRHKPWVRLSCSPIGKYRDLARFSSRGWNAYDVGFQEAQRWLSEGLMDMLVPMMYFRDAHFYPFLYDWQENAAGRIVVAGLGPYMMREKNWPVDIFERECAVARQAGTAGQCYFRSQFLTDGDGGLMEFLKHNFYTRPALTPALTWEAKHAPAPPTLLRSTDTPRGYRLTWQPSADDNVRYNIYRSSEWPVDIERAENMIAHHVTDCLFDVAMPVPQAMRPHYAVTAIDRYGCESQPVALRSETHYLKRMANGLLTIDGDTLILPAGRRDAYVMLTDAQGRPALTMPYRQRIGLASLRPGVYDVRTLGRKGQSERYGTIFWF